MIQEDFANFHNHACEALNAAWKLAWSILAAMFNRLYQASLWMRNLAEPQARTIRIEPVKLKFETGPKPNA